MARQAEGLRAFDQHARDASAALVDARVAQQAYVATGQGVAFWFGKTAAAVQSASDGLAALRESAGTGARTAVDEAAATVVEFSAIDGRARDYLKSGEQLMAGDVIFTEGSDAAATAVRQIETARQAQHQAADVDAAAVRKQQVIIAGSAAGVVFLLMLALIPVPRARAAEPVAETSLSIKPIVQTSKPIVQTTAPAAPPAAAAAAMTSHAQGTVV
ncbi:MAG: hypothetical protein JWL71_868 [Acidobacteria bacterium]|nr:hypothetical protein [Acidobacteriota bacterium]